MGDKLLVRVCAPADVGQAYNQDETPVIPFASMVTAKEVTRWQSIPENRRHFSRVLVLFRGTDWGRKLGLVGNDHV